MGIIHFRIPAIGGEAAAYNCWMVVGQVRKQFDSQPRDFLVASKGITAKGMDSRTGDPVTLFPEMVAVRHTVWVMMATCHMSEDEENDADDDDDDDDDDNEEEEERRRS